MSDTELSTLQGLPNDSVPHPQQADNPQILEELRQAIDMGQGDFALLMVRCNYRNLQEQLLETLHGTTDLEIAEVTLAPKETSLYSAILAQVEESSPAALSVLELDQVEALDDVLASANHMRESFRQRFSFPLLLWVDDRLMAHIRRRMPDFKSWGATTFRFDLDTEALLAQLQATCDRYLEGALQRAAFTPTTDLLSPQDSREADLAVSELDRRRVRLPPNLAGSLEFHLGALLYGENPRPSPKTCEAALAHYQTGLAHWQTAQNALGIGLAHFYRSLCHAQQQDWDAAKRERQACLDAFTTAERPDLAARFVGSLGPVLVALEDWQELERCLPQWQALHKDQPTELAQDWSLQAEVAKHQQDWLQMQADSEKAIAIWTQRDSSSPAPLPYRLQQCEALAQQGHVATAIEHLEAARRSHLPKEDPLAFVQLLNQLRQLYFQEKQYQKAFEIKQERRSIQYQFQMRAFIGAGQLQPQKTADPTAETHASFVASGRQEDINTLVNVRVSEPRHKLTVLCGLSGVGKSSLVRAGLVPALTGKQLRDRRALTVVMRIYSHWETALGEALYAALAAYPEARLEAAPTSAEQLKAQLRRNAEHHLLTVLIFDQFEEFFFICTQPAQRRVFYEFLRDCLKGTDIQFVKVIFSLREDYLHELLEFEDFVKDLGVDFLSREQRQRIENFTPAIARSVITELSQRTTLRLDEELVDALVDSLTNELGRIRPVELQVVGAQLEAEGITTLAKYRQLGENPKLVLAESWVGAVVADCGSENADAAWQVLVALTQENGTRPLLTMGELAAALKDYQRLLGTGAVSLESDILPVLVGSGLVVRWPQEPEDRYQLVHDYLVEPIRRRYNADYRQQLEQLVKGKQAAEAKQQQEEDRRKRLQRWTLRGALGAVVVFAGLAAFAGVMAIRSYRLAKASERAEKLATARQLAAQAERILQQQPNLRPMAALLAVESYRRFTQQKHSPIEADVPLRKALNRLPQSVINIDHEDRVWVVSFSENSQYLATGSEDGTVKIIEVATGDEITSIEHGAGVKRVAFSENSQYLATGSEDGTVKIIEVATGNEITSIEHGAIANRVVFSEDNQYLATSSADGTAKLTEVATSNEIASIDHEETVWDISFSQDSQYLATSSADGTAKIIEVATGNEITSIDHEASATVLGFSQDSQYLITGSTDSIAKLVEVATGNEIASINHEASIRSVGFSQDSQYLATGSADSTAKLVEVPTGNEVVTIDHETMVDSVSFSQNSQYLATGSTDGTAKLIEVATGNEIATFDHGTAIDNVSFSQNSQYLVISSLDGTAKLIEVATGSEIANINHEVRYAKYQRIVRLISPLRQEEENRNVVFSENSQYFATGGLDGTAKLIEVATGKEIASINHERWVNRVIFSENSQYLLTISADGIVKLIEAATGDEIAFIEHEFGFNNTIFSKNSQYLATGGGDHTAKLILLDFNDIQGEQILISRTDRTPITISKNSQYLVTHGRDDEIKLIEVATGNKIATIDHEARVSFTSFSQDSQYLATVSADGTAKLIEVATGTQIATVDHEQGVRSIVFSGNSQYLATNCYDGTAKIIEVVTGNEIVTLDHEGGVNSLSFSRDSQYLATDSSDGTAKLIEVATGNEIASINHEERINSLSFSPDSQYLVTSSYNKATKLIQVATGNEIASIDHEAGVSSVVFSEDSQYLATRSSDTMVKVIEVAAGKEITSVDHGERIEILNFSENSQYLATGSNDGTAKLIEVATGNEIANINHKEGVDSVSFSDDSQYLVTSNYYGTAKLLEVATGNVIASEEGVRNVSFSQDSQYFATSKYDDTVKLIEMATGNVITTIDHEERVEIISFSKDSQYLATGSTDGTAKLVEVATGSEVGIIEHEEKIGSIHFSEDGQYFATSSHDGTAKLIDVSTGNEIALIEHEREISSLVFSKDSKNVVTSSIDGQVLLTRISTMERRADKICDRIQRNLSADEWNRYIGTSLTNYRLTCPNAPVHPTILNEAGELIGTEESRISNHQEARAILLNMQQLEPGIDLYPETDAVDTDIDDAIQAWQVAHTIDLGLFAAQNNNLDIAKILFEEAKTQAPEIDLDPITIALDTDPEATAKAIAARYKVNEIVSYSLSIVSRVLYSLEELQAAQEIDPYVEIPLDVWDRICWSGSLRGYYNEVLDACEAAVDLKPNHGGYRDSRGLARALTGDTAGAIADFQAYIAWSGSPPRRKRQRQQWIDALQAGENPFTEDLLKQLREE